MISCDRSSTSCYLLTIYRNLTYGRAPMLTGLGETGSQVPLLIASGSSFSSVGGSKCVDSVVGNVGRGKPATRRVLRSFSEPGTVRLVMGGPFDQGNGGQESITSGDSRTVEVCSIGAAPRCKVVTWEPNYWCSSVEPALSCRPVGGSYTRSSAGSVKRTRLPCFRSQRQCYSAERCVSHKTPARGHR